MENFAILVGVVLALAIAERLAPLRERRRETKSRWLTNFLLALPALAVSAAAIFPTVRAMQAWTDQAHFGLLALFAAPAWVEAILAFLLLDLTFYAWHRLNHRVGWLWRFHVVHHADPDLDLSTAVRFHFGELLLSVVFRVAQIALIGPPLATLLIYGTVFQSAVFFHHSNTRLPAGLDGALRWLIVTPRVHGIHHSQVHAETDSNYGTIFSLWDRLARTFRGDVPQASITIGVPGYDARSENAARPMLAAPFRVQPQYWQE